MSTNWKTSTDRHGEYWEPELGRVPIHTIISSDRNPALTYADPLPPHLPSNPRSVFCLPSFISASPSLKLLIDLFTAARGLVHLGRASTAGADFLINSKFTKVLAVLYSSTCAQQ
ncbi:hypothetical protein JOB18_026757 [Solea senegalensis]|uniref:Uncharacterized protein n=1 Tax=Solea senegalensis TaxID=28829 RepID=A0AAV6REQ0_SOLSE|nr:hypothetical protein JOB18_026757 [Solea senegalensis]